MDFDSYSNHLSDLTEYYSEFLQNPNPVQKIEQKIFQDINESMQIKSVYKVQLGQLNDIKDFTFRTDLIITIQSSIFRTFKKRKE